MRLSHVLAGAAALLWFVPPVSAAPPPAPVSFSLHGVVVDPDRAPIASARISVDAPDRQERKTTVADGAGAFEFVLPPGRYTITAEADGFSPASMEFAASPGAQSSVALVLPIARVSETVNVTAPRPGYDVASIASGTKTLTPVRDVPQAITVVSRQLIDDQQMQSIADVVRYMPGVTAHQGENNRDQVIIRGNSSSADFFVNGVRDDVQYYRDLYNVDRVEALKGPNAMIFGRGGGGGVINRVRKEPVFSPVRELSLVGGSYGDTRFSADINQPLGDRLAMRVNGVYENSESFRQSVGLERGGISPSLTFMPGTATKLTVGYEHFRDDRVADRGVPSFNRRPAGVSRSAYFGDPANSHVNARVDAFSAALDHQFGNITVHNHTLIGDYERGYQNFVPGAVASDGARASLTAYNNDTKRLNVFNQTDLTASARTGSIKHELLGGAEFGRQSTDNFKNTGYFDNGATSISVPLTDGITRTPVTFRQSATDADNHLRAAVAAAYAQDQVSLSRFIQVIAGLRLDLFDLQYHNNRTGNGLGRTDVLVSPRAGVVFKPADAVSLYASTTVSYLPSSGDQFSSLTAITEQMKPEKFTNVEFGSKWDLGSGLSLTAAVYRLDRTNTRATDPSDPTRILQTGQQRTNGVELGWNGRVTSRWQVAGGYTWQDAFIVSATAAAKAGAQVAQVPHQTLSLWNMYRIAGRFTAGLGVVRRTDMFAAIDNTVVLPGYTEVNAAMFIDLTSRLRLQGNVENLFDRTFYVNADNNTNISPGSPRAAKMTLIARF